MALENWLGFSAVAFVATVLPGPAMLMVITHSLSYGALKSIATILGNLVGLTILSSFSILGLSSLVLLSANAFMLIKVVGALYLVYLGAKIVINGLTISTVEAERKPKSVLMLFVEGLVVAISNPKAIIFTTALFPQFIDTNAPLLPQFSILMLTLLALSFTCLLTSAALIRLPLSLAGGSRLQHHLTKLFGGLLLAAGVTLASNLRAST